MTSKPKACFSKQHTGLQNLVLKGTDGINQSGACQTFLMINIFHTVKEYIYTHQAKQWLQTILTFLFCFLQQLHHFALPPTLYKGPSFCTFLLTLVIFCFVDSNHLKGCEVASQLAFICISLRFSDTEQLSHAYGPFVNLL